MSIVATKVVRLGWRVVPFKKAIRPIVRRVVATRAMPGCWLRSFRLYKILAFDYGYLRSAATFRSIDAAGNPLPWITYPAIDFLRQMDLSEKSIFEYGCGGSTLFLSAIAPSVHSVENNPEYYREFRPLVPSNCTLLFEPGEDEFIQAVSRHGPYDVIMIDGHSRMRCARLAPEYLKPGGFIILDNSDWYHDASAVLRAADLIEVDMSGMSPIADFVSTTSFYFRRDFTARPKVDRQPVGAIGSIPKPKFSRETASVGPDSVVMGDARSSNSC